MDISYYKKYEPIFGAWHIVREIGEGSFGKVFEIEREDFGRTYKAALKAITIPQNQSEVKSAMADGMDKESVTTYFQDFVEDLVDEFSIMSELKGHSNIVSYEDHMVVKHNENVGWDILIRMELLTPLIDYIQTKTLDRNEVIKLGIDICRALEACRASNIIHRDIKPENICVSKRGDFKLSDFGIAKTVDKTTGGLSKKGTCTYMAPEIYKGESYGPSVDIYSLGIVLYRFFNDNRTPFLPVDIVPTYREREMAMARRIKGEAIPAPANADKAFADVILKACAYNPKDRYASPTEMRIALENLAADTAAFAPEVKTEIPSISEAETETDRTVLLFDVAEKNKIIEDAAEAETVSGAVGDLDKTISEFSNVDSLVSAETEKESTDTQKVEKENEKARIKEKKQTDTAKTNKQKKKNRPKTILAIAAILAILAIAIITLNYQKEINETDTVNIVSIDAAGNHTVCLKSDGTVIATEDSKYGSSEVDEWENVIEVSTGFSHTVGLKSDGTLFAAGANKYGSCELSSWTGIVAVAVGEFHTVGLKEDGTVISTGRNDFGQCEVSEWTDITKVAAGGQHTVGIKRDGTVVAVGSNNYGQCEVNDWTGIVAVAAGDYHTVGLKSDGTVVATGDNRCAECETDLSNGWSNVVAIAAGDNYTVGIKSDGTAVAIGDNENGQCDVANWTELVDISAGTYHTVGLKSDGTIVASGDNSYGQCNISD